MKITSTVYTRHLKQSYGYLKTHVFNTLLLQIESIVNKANAGIKFLYFICLICVISKIVSTESWILIICVFYAL